MYGPASEFGVAAEIVSTPVGQTVSLPDSSVGSSRPPHPVEATQTLEPNILVSRFADISPNSRVCVNLPPSIPDNFKRWGAIAADSPQPDRDSCTGLDAGSGALGVLRFFGNSTWAFPVPSHCRPKRREPWRRCDAVGVCDAPRETKPVDSDRFPNRTTQEQRNSFPDQRYRPVSPAHQERTSKRTEPRTAIPGAWVRPNLLGRRRLRPPIRGTSLRSDGRTKRRNEPGAIDGTPFPNGANVKRREAHRSAPGAHPPAKGCRRGGCDRTTAPVLARPTKQSQARRSRLPKRTGADGRNPLQDQQYRPQPPAHRRRTTGRPRRHTAQTWTSSLCPSRFG